MTQDWKTPEARQREKEARVLVGLAVVFLAIILSHTLVQKVVADLVEIPLLVVAWRTFMTPRLRRRRQR